MPTPTDRGKSSQAGKKLSPESRAEFIEAETLGKHLGASLGR